MSEPRDTQDHRAPPSHPWAFRCAEHYESMMPDDGSGPDMSSEHNLARAYIDLRAEVTSLKDEREVILGIIADATD